MKRFFGHNKSRINKSTGKDGQPLASDDTLISTPIYQQHAASAGQSLPPLPPSNLSQQTLLSQGSQVPRNPSREDSTHESFDAYVSLPPGSPSVPPSPSPHHASQTHVLSPNKQMRDRDRDTQSLRRSPLPGQPIVSNILRALESPNVGAIPYTNRSASEDGYSTVDIPVRDPQEYAERREKKSFWSRDRNKDNDRDRDKSGRDRGRDFQRKDDEAATGLSKMIGYLTATASEDWGLVLDVCERASANETNAKEAVKTLRREFKYGEPANQLSAARLWAIMLRNCSDTFISQSATRKFLDSIEELLMNPKTSPVVRERLLDVIAAAAYASGLKKDVRNDREGFRGLWRRVKPIDKPDEGVPFALDDAMFNPPVSSRTSQYGGVPFSPQEPQPLTTDVVPISPPPPMRPHKKRKSPTRNRIIPHDEDVRRLLQECKIGQGNASLLSQALFHAKPETFKKDSVIREFSQKCRSSQELIFAQIPWATAEAERSILARDAKVKSKELDGDVQETTKEQHLLDAILAANGELLEVLKQYDDMDRVAMERKVEYRSMKELKMNPRELPEYQEQPIRNSIQHAARPTSRSPSSSPRSVSPHQSLHEPRRLYPDAITGTLAPPPSVPHGPRSPGQISAHSRTPSPNTAPVEVGERNTIHHLDSGYDDVVDSSGTPALPSVKALGKQKAVETELSDSYAQPIGDIYYDAAPNRRNSHSFDDSDREEHSDPPWHRPIHYVYDAAAEREAQRLRDEYEQQTPLVNGVH